MVLDDSQRGSHNIVLSGADFRNLQGHTQVSQAVQNDAVRTFRDYPAGLDSRAQCSLIEDKENNKSTTVVDNPCLSVKNEIAEDSVCSPRSIHSPDTVSGVVLSKFSTSVDAKLAKVLDNLNRLTRSEPLASTGEMNGKELVSNEASIARKTPNGVGRQRIFGGRLAIVERLDVFEPQLKKNQLDDDPVKPCNLQKLNEDTEDNATDNVDCFVEKSLDECTSKIGCLTPPRDNVQEFQENVDPEIERFVESMCARTELQVKNNAKRRRNGRLGIEQRIDVFEPNLRPAHRSIEEEYGPLGSVKRHNICSEEDSSLISAATSDTSACASYVLYDLEAIQHEKLAFNLGPVHQAQKDKRDRQNDSLLRHAVSSRIDFSLSSGETNKHLKRCAFDTFSDIDDIVMNPFVAFREREADCPTIFKKESCRSAAILDYLREFASVKANGSFDGSSVASLSMTMAQLQKTKRSSTLGESLPSAPKLQGSIESECSRAIENTYSNNRDVELSRSQGQRTILKTCESSKPSQSTAILSYLQEYSNIKGKASFDSVSTTTRTFQPSTVAKASSPVWSINHKSLTDESSAFMDTVPEQYKMISLSPNDPSTRKSKCIGKLLAENGSMPDTIDVTSATKAQSPVPEASLVHSHRRLPMAAAVGITSQPEHQVLFSLSKHTLSTMDERNLIQDKLFAHHLSSPVLKPKHDVIDLNGAAEARCLAPESRFVERSLSTETSVGINTHPEQHDVLPLSENVAASHEKSTRKEQDPTQNKLLESRLASADLELQTDTSDLKVATRTHYPVGIDAPVEHHEVSLCPEKALTSNDSSATDELFSMQDRLCECHQSLTLKHFIELNGAAAVQFTVLEPRKARRRLSTEDMTEIDSLTEQHEVFSHSPNDLSPNEQLQTDTIDLGSKGATKTQYPVGIDSPMEHHEALSYSEQTLTSNYSSTMDELHSIQDRLCETHQSLTLKHQTTMVELNGASDVQFTGLEPRKARRRLSTEAMAEIDSLAEQHEVFSHSLNELKPNEKLQTDTIDLGSKASIKAQYPVGIDAPVEHYEALSHSEETLTSNDSSTMDELDCMQDRLCETHQSLTLKHQTTMIELNGAADVQFTVLEPRKVRRRLSEETIAEIDSVAEQHEVFSHSMNDLAPNEHSPMSGRDLTKAITPLTRLSSTALNHQTVPIDLKGLSESQLPPLGSTEVDVKLSVGLSHSILASSDCSTMNEQGATHNKKHTRTLQSPRTKHGYTYDLSYSKNSAKSSKTINLNSDSIKNFAGVETLVTIASHETDRDTSCVQEIDCNDAPFVELAAAGFTRANALRSCDKTIASSSDRQSEIKARAPAPNYDISVMGEKITEMATEIRSRYDCDPGIQLAADDIHHSEPAETKLVQVNAIRNSRWGEKHEPTCYRKEKKLDAFRPIARKISNSTTIDVGGWSSGFATQGVREVYAEHSRQRTVSVRTLIDRWGGSDNKTPSSSLSPRVGHVRGILSRANNHELSNAENLNSDPGKLSRNPTPSNRFLSTKDNSVSSVRHAVPFTQQPGMYNSVPTSKSEPRPSRVMGEKKRVRSAPKELEQPDKEPRKTCYDAQNPLVTSNRNKSSHEFSSGNKDSRRPSIMNRRHCATPNSSKIMELSHQKHETERRSRYIQHVLSNHDEIVMDLATSSTVQKNSAPNPGAFDPSQFHHSSVRQTGSGIIEDYGLAAFDKRTDLRSARFWPRIVSDNLLSNVMNCSSSQPLCSHSIGTSIGPCDEISACKVINSVQTEIETKDCLQGSKKIASADCHIMTSIRVIGKSVDSDPQALRKTRTAHQSINRKILSPYGVQMESTGCNEYLVSQKETRSFDKVKGKHFPSRNRERITVGDKRTIDLDALPAESTIALETSNDPEGKEKKQNPKAVVLSYLDDPAQDKLFDKDHVDKCNSMRDPPGTNLLGHCTPDHLFSCRLSTCQTPCDSNGQEEARVSEAVCLQGSAPPRTFIVLKGSLDVAVLPNCIVSDRPNAGKNNEVDNETTCQKVPILRPKQVVQVKRSSIGSMHSGNHLDSPDLCRPSYERDLGTVPRPMIHQCVHESPKARSELVMHRRTKVRALKACSSSLKAKTFADMASGKGMDDESQGNSEGDLPFVIMNNAAPINQREISETISISFSNDQGRVIPRIVESNSQREEDLGVNESDKIFFERCLKHRAEITRLKISHTDVENGMSEDSSTNCNAVPETASDESLRSTIAGSTRFSQPDEETPVVAEIFYECRSEPTAFEIDDTRIEIVRSGSIEKPTCKNSNPTSLNNLPETPILTLKLKTYDESVPVYEGQRSLELARRIESGVENVDGDKRQGVSERMETLPQFHGPDGGSACSHVGIGERPHLCFDVGMTPTIRRLSNHAFSDEAIGLILSSHNGSLTEESPSSIWSNRTSSFDVPKDSCGQSAVGRDNIQIESPPVAIANAVSSQVIRYAEKIGTLQRDICEYKAPPLHSFDTNGTRTSTFYIEETPVTPVAPTKMNSSKESLFQDYESKKVDASRYEEFEAIAKDLNFAAARSQESSSEKTSCRNRSSSQEGEKETPSNQKGPTKDSSIRNHNQRELFSSCLEPLSNSDIAMSGLRAMSVPTDRLLVDDSVNFELSTDCSKHSTNNSTSSNELREKLPSLRAQITELTAIGASEQRNGKLDDFEMSEHIESLHIHSITSLVNSAVHAKRSTLASQADSQRSTATSLDSSWLQPDREAYTELTSDGTYSHIEPRTIFFSNAIVSDGALRLRWHSSGAHEAPNSDLGVDLPDHRINISGNSDSLPDLMLDNVKQCLLAQTCSRSKMIELTADDVSERNHRKIVDSGLDPLCNCENPTKLNNCPRSVEKSIEPLGAEASTEWNGRNTCFVSGSLKKKSKYIAACGPTDEAINTELSVDSPKNSSNYERLPEMHETFMDQQRHGCSKSKELKLHTSTSSNLISHPNELKLSANCFTQSLLNGYTAGKIDTSERRSLSSPINELNPKLNTDDRFFHVDSVGSNTKLTSETNSFHNGILELGSDHKATCQSPCVIIPILDAVTSVVNTVDHRPQSADPVFCAESDASARRFDTLYFPTNEGSIKPILPEKSTDTIDIDAESSVQELACSETMSNQHLHRDPNMSNRLSKSSLTINEDDVPSPYNFTTEMHEPQLSGSALAQKMKVRKLQALHLPQSQNENTVITVAACTDFVSPNLESTIYSKYSKNDTGDAYQHVEGLTDRKGITGLYDRSEFDGSSADFPSNDLKVIDSNLLIGYTPELFMDENPPKPIDSNPDDYLVGYSSDGDGCNGIPFDDISVSIASDAAVDEGVSSFAYSKSIERWHRKNEFMFPTNELTEQVTRFGPKKVNVSEAESLSSFFSQDFESHFRDSTEYSDQSRRSHSDSASGSTTSISESSSQKVVPAGRKLVGSSIDPPILPTSPPGDLKYLNPLFTATTTESEDANSVDLNDQGWCRSMFCFSDLKDIICGTVGTEAV